jgi:hypothetical protein
MAAVPIRGDLHPPDLRALARRERDGRVGARRLEPVAGVMGLHVLLPAPAAGRPRNVPFAERSASELRLDR